MNIYYTVHNCTKTHNSLDDILKQKSPNDKSTLNSKLKFFNTVFDCAKDVTP